MIKHIMKQKTFYIMAVLILVTTSGCGIQKTIEQKVTEEVVEKSIEQSANGNVDVDFNNGTTTINVNGQEISAQTGDNIKLPSNWREDIPLPDGITLKSAIVDATGSGTILFETNDSSEDIKNYFTETLEKNGWEKTAYIEVEDGTSLGFDKKDDATVSITTNTRESPLQVSLFVIEK